VESNMNLLNDTLIEQTKTGSQQTASSRIRINRQWPFAHIPYKVLFISHPTRFGTSVFIYCKE